jgi:hypothetical protein
MIKLQKISNTSILVKHSNILLLISFTDLKIFFQLLNQQSIVTIILYNSHHKVIINITINNHSNQKDDRSYQNNHRLFLKSIDQVYFPIGGKNFPSSMLLSCLCSLSSDKLLSSFLPLFREVFALGAVK